MWDSHTGKTLAVLEGHEDIVWSAAFSPDGQRVATISSDGTAQIWSIRFATWQDLVNEGWSLVWSANTASSQLLVYLLGIDTIQWRKLKGLIQQVDYLRNHVLQLTPEQREAWSFYLLSWLWQRMTWDDVESMRQAQFEQMVIAHLGEDWQPIASEKKRFWEQWSPDYYNQLLLEKLESVWNTWSLAQQAVLLAQLAALTPVVTNGSFERYGSWIAEDEANVNRVDDSVRKPYHGERFLALGSDEKASRHVSQGFPTVAGHTYTLSFAFTAPADGVELLRVFWNGELLEELAAVGEEWQVYHYTVTAVDEKAKLAFQGVGYVDAVSVMMVE